MTGLEKLYNIVLKKPTNTATETLSRTIMVSWMLTDLS